jgi:hypothetical protein
MLPDFAHILNPEHLTGKCSPAAQKSYKHPGTHYATHVFVCGLATAEGRKESWTDRLLKGDEAKS